MKTMKDIVEELRTEARDLPKQERNRYRTKGWKIIEPGTPAGDYHGLTRDAWRLDSFLAREGDVVEISLIFAKQRGHGAFSKLLHRLEHDLECKVRVVCPLPTMTSILTKKGFVSRTEGTKFEDRLDIWERPQ